MKISDQTREAVASIVRHPEAIERLTGKTRQRIVEDPVGSLACLDQEVPRDMPMELIEWVGKVEVSSVTTGRFSAPEKFKLKKDGGICSHLSYKFREHFLKDGGKTEDLIPAGTLRFGRLRLAVLDLPQEARRPNIIYHLCRETTLSEMWYLMDKQALGEEGVLLTNSYANMFFVKDKKGALCTVFVYWCGGWSVGMTSVAGPDKWRDDFRVFSRLQSSVPQAVAS